MPSIGGPSIWIQEILSHVNNRCRRRREAVNKTHRRYDVNCS